MRKILLLAFLSVAMTANAAVGKGTGLSSSILTNFNLGDFVVNVTGAPSNTITLNLPQVTPGSPDLPGDLLTFIQNNFSGGGTNYWTNQFGFLTPIDPAANVSVLNMLVTGRSAAQQTIFGLNDGTTNFIDPSFTSEAYLVNTGTDTGSNYLTTIIALGDGVDTVQYLDIFSYTNIAPFTAGFTLPANSSLPGGGIVKLFADKDFIGAQGRGITLKFVQPNWVEVGRWDNTTGTMGTGDTLWTNNTGVLQNIGPSAKLLFTGTNTTGNLLEVANATNTALAYNMTGSLGGTESLDVYASGIPNVRLGTGSNPGLYGLTGNGLYLEDTNGIIFGRSTVNPAWYLGKSGSSDLIAAVDGGPNIGLSGNNRPAWVYTTTGFGIGTNTFTQSANLPQWNGAAWPDGGGVAGTVINTGASLATQYAKYTDTTGTNVAPHTITLASADFANQGTTTTLLHGNASGNPSWGSVTAADAPTLAPLANSPLTGTTTINGASVETQLTNKVDKLLTTTQTMSGPLTTPDLLSGGYSVARATLTHAGTVTLDCSITNRYASLTLTGNVTFATANLTAGKWYNVIVTMTATNDTPTFPAWRWLGGAPSTLTASQIGVLSIYPTSTTDATTLAAYTETQ